MKPLFLRGGREYVSWPAMKVPGTQLFPQKIERLDIGHDQLLGEEPWKSELKTMIWLRSSGESSFFLDIYIYTMYIYIYTLEVQDRTKDDPCKGFPTTNGQSLVFGLPGYT